MTIKQTAFNSCTDNRVETVVKMANIFDPVWNCPIPCVMGEKKILCLTAI